MTRFFMISGIIAAGTLAMNGSTPGRRLEPDDVVATVRGKAITYRMIRCHPEIDLTTAKRLHDSRSLEQICLDAERTALRHRLTTALIEAAAEICPIVPTDDELRMALPNVFDEEDIDRSARIFRAKAMVVRRANRGEDAAKLINELLVPLGVGGESFLKEMAYWTPEGAERVLSTDYSSVVREQRKHDATVAAVRRELSRRHGGDDEARRHFWDEMIRVTKTTVREGFEMPDWRQLP
jgi:hypothetical protein